MSIFGDYKAYKKYEPAYSSWKFQRETAEAKRQKYLQLNPEKINQEDVQRGKVLLRAIDIMDEYSQKRAEDMEVATETVVGYGLDAAIFGGAAIGSMIGYIKPVKNGIKKLFGNNQKIAAFFPMAFGAIAGVIAAFPLYAWAAKAEVSASRRGRFESMRKDLNNPKGFAVLTNEQILEANQRAKRIILKDDKKSSIKQGLSTLKEMSGDSKEYKKQKQLFDLELAESQKHLNDEMTQEEIERAKKDQQLLTNLVEKIDIASQDYAENAELATQTVVAGTLALGTLFNIALTKILNTMKIKSAAKISAISQIAAVAVPICLSIAGAQIQKQASRVGRFKIKQELMNNPASLAYVSDENLADIKHFTVQQDKKEGMFNFLKNAWKNNKEFNNYKKTKAKQEERFYKAVETLEMTPEQIKNAKILQRNTFKTFNKVDEKSQKYSESIEALGQAVSLPISLLCIGIGTTLGGKYINTINIKNKLEAVSSISRYTGIVLLSTLPSIIINALITKEQKKASRIADMLAINEMSDYKQFR